MRLRREVIDARLTEYRPISPSRISWALARSPATRVGNLTHVNPPMPLPQILKIPRLELHSRRQRVCRL